VTVQADGPRRGGEGELHSLWVVLRAQPTATPAKTQRDHASNSCHDDPPGLPTSLHIRFGSIARREKTLLESSTQNQPGGKYARPNHDADGRHARVQ
jgi:hypothetical protein